MPPPQAQALIASSGETGHYVDADGSNVYRVSGGFDLDQYLFRDASPLDFSIDIEHDYGPVTIHGSPDTGHELLDKTVRLTLRLWDVDEDQGERDVLYVGGTAIPGFLSGSHDQWSIQTFEIPGHLLFFPAQENPNGTNDFSIDIDTTQAGWAVQVDWAELRLESPTLPVAFLHGITADGERMVFTESYFVSQLPNELLPGLTARPSFEDRNFQQTEEILGPVADDLLDAANSRQLNVVAHSQGGLRARQYAWDNPGEVANIVTLGSPHGGAELADQLCEVRHASKVDPTNEDLSFFNTLTGHMGPCDSDQDPLWQLTTDYVRNVFNKQVPDRFSTRIGTIAGEGFCFETSFFIVSGGDNDCTVTVDSVNWLNHERADHPGKHFSASPTVAANHGELIEEDSPGFGAAFCFAYPALLSTQTCPQAGETLDTNSQGASLQAVSGAAHEVTFRTGLSVPAGQTVNVPITFEPSLRGSITAITGNPAVTAAFEGSPLMATTTFEIPTLALEIASPQSGTLVLTNTGTEAADVAVVAGIDTDRFLALDAPATASSGSPVEISVTLNGAQAGDSVAGRVLDSAGGPAAELSLTSTGTGSWTSTFTPAVGGSYTFLVWTEGDNRRVDTAPVSVSHGRASVLPGITDELIGTEDGMADALRVHGSVDVQTAGTYSIAASLQTADGTLVASTGLTADFTTGVSAIALDFDGAAIYASGLNGPYDVGPVVVSRRDATGSSIEHEAASIGTTGTYQFAQFQHFPVEFERSSFTDAGVDVNGDGIYETLSVSGVVRVDTGGTYAVNAKLRTLSGIEVSESRAELTLASGSNTFVMEFPGDAIAASGQDGPYVVADVSAYPTANADTLGYLLEAHRTAAYSVTDFGGAVVGEPTQRISVATAGSEGNGASGNSSPPAVSADGRYVAFVSAASNLVSDDTNGVEDVFVRDRLSGETRRVSVGSSGLQANAPSLEPSISGDGRYVAFTSYAANLVSGDANGKSDAFVHDLQTGVTERLSVSDTGVQGNNPSAAPSVSHDGQYVAFASHANNLVSGDTNRKWDIFVRDRAAGITSRISLTDSEGEASGTSLAPSISADGQHVAFTSDAVLVSDDTNKTIDVYVRDVSLGTTTRASVASNGDQTNKAVSDDPAISADGRYVAFASHSSDLVSGDTNKHQDVFVHDRDTGNTTRVSGGIGGAQTDNHNSLPAISSDGTRVAFTSLATNVIEGDTNFTFDVFVHDRTLGTTVRASLSNAGEEANGSSGTSGIAISGDGHSVIFDSAASNLVADDANGQIDVFSRNVGTP